MVHIMVILLDNKERARGHVLKDKTHYALLLAVADLLIDQTQTPYIIVR
jgi:hypothetical protein